MPRITYLYGAPTSSYLICTTPRSGSTFLSQALTSIGIAGRPEEYFQQTGDTGVPRGPSQYLGEVAATLPESLGPPAGDTLVDPMFDPRRFTHSPSTPPGCSGPPPPATASSAPRSWRRTWRASSRACAPRWTRTCPRRTTACWRRCSRACGTSA